MLVKINIRTELYLEPSADVIVDITSTGATLKANGLKILSDGLILKSEAVFAVSPGAVWSPEAKASLEVLFAGAAIKPKELIEKI